MNLYHNIVFCQGDDAAEPLQILDEHGVAKAIDYLAQWDMGSEMEHSPTTEEPWGSSDYTEKRGRYILSYNLRLGHIGLTRVERVNKKKYEAEQDEIKKVIIANRIASEDKILKNLES